MDNNIGTVILRCDDYCCMLVVDKYRYVNSQDNSVEIDYNFSMQDSNLDGYHNTIGGRLRRAWKALMGKPIYFNDIYVEDQNKVIKFRNELTELIEKSQ
jgi:hypothetical protein